MSENERVTTCNDCGREISKSADKCPHCGAVTQAAASRMLWVVVATIIAVIALFALCDPLQEFMKMTP